jgi:outer membrane receptor protein involved in Fe transport
MNSFWHWVLLTAFIISASASRTHAQDTSSYKYIRIAGTLVDSESSKGVDFAGIQILSVDGKSDPESPIGTVTDEKGRFDFSFRYKAPFKIVTSHVSYKPAELVVNEATFQRLEIKLVPLTVEGEVVYVTSEIYPADELDLGITTDKVSSVDVQQIASFNVFDLVSTLREVDVATQSMNLQSVSTRGFNMGANPRFLQLTDGIDNQAPGLGFSLGNLLGPSELDIAGIELIVGPASARYGSSAMNGALLTSSKNPFEVTGLALSIKNGVHHVRVGGDSPWGVEGDRMLNGSFRFAQKLSDHFAFKITGTHINGQDWRATNYDNIGPGKSNLTIDDIPGFNGVNIYGDESFVMLPVGKNEDGEVTNEFVPVTRTGYAEADLVNYDIATNKLAGGVYYRSSSELEMQLEAKYGYTNTLFTGESRIRLQDFEIFQVNGEVNYKNGFVRAFSTMQNSGNSYNVDYLAKMIQNAKTDLNWYRDFELAFTRGIPFLGVAKNDINAARRFADSGATLIYTETAEQRYEVGTARYDSVRTMLANTVGFDDGAAIRDNSGLYNIEFGVESISLNDKFELDAGGNYRFYDLDSDGTIFPDTAGNNITNYEVALYSGIRTSFLDEDLKISAAVRIDKNENFAPRLNQQVGFSYKVSDKSFLRFSYQNGFRYPSVREQFLNTNIGEARLLGGLSLITHPYNVQGNSFFEANVQAYNEAVLEDITLSPFEDVVYNRAQAELNNIDILQNGIVSSDDITKIKPERTNSFELGYRQLLTTNLYLDVNYFASFYDNFVGIKRIIKPRTSPEIDLFASAGQVNSSLESDKFYIFSNAESLVVCDNYLC